MVAGYGQRAGAVERTDARKSIQNEGFEFFRVTKGTFRDGRWVPLLKRRLEELQELGKKAPQGRWAARGRAWGRLGHCLFHGPVCVDIY